MGEEIILCDISGGLAINGVIPTQVQGSPFSTTLVATGAIGTVSWDQAAIFNQLGIPADIYNGPFQAPGANGLTLTDNGDGSATIAGTPTKACGWGPAGKIYVTDQAGQVAWLEWPWTAKWQTTWKSAGTVSHDISAGVPFSYDLNDAMSGGPNVDAVFWYVLSGGFPDGLSFDVHTGIVSGTPVGASGANTATILPYAQGYSPSASSDTDLIAGPEVLLVFNLS